MKKSDSKIENKGECIVHLHPVPAEDLWRYSPERDPHSEQDIASYVEIQAPDEEVRNVEKVKQEIVLGNVYEIWDVITDKDRWWVITNLTNLYSQRYFPSLDYTLSFHIGLMMRLRSRHNVANSEDPTPFDEVFRRQEQAIVRHDNAIEAEDYQAVGMQLRECLISLVGALRRRVPLAPDAARPQDSNFLEWSSLLSDILCRGGSNKELRKHLKNTAKEAWQLVNWLTHDRSANKTASSIAIHACETVVGHFVQILERDRTDWNDLCPVCNSRHIRTHFDPSIGPDGEYYMTCGVCDWNNHPGEA
jgi:hypothetical protein